MRRPTWTSPTAPSLNATRRSTKRSGAMAQPGCRAPSGRAAVLVDKPAEDIDPFDPSNLVQAGRRRFADHGGHAEADAGGRAAGVVVRHVLGHDLLQVTPVPD